MAETRKVRLTRRWNFGGVFYGPEKGGEPMEVEMPAHLADIADMLEQPAREAEADAAAAKKAERAAARKGEG